MRSFTNSLQRQGPGHIGILFIHNANAFMHGTEMLKVYFKQAMDGCGRALIEFCEQCLGKAIGISGRFNGGILATGAAPDAKWNDAPPRSQDEGRRRGRQGAYSDAELLAKIEAVIEASPFNREACRKVGVQLREDSVRTAARRVRRIISENSQLAPQGR
jgi:hypothetical protein